MEERRLELGEAELLLDVVFGVVIGLALTELPGKVWGALRSPGPESLWPPLLLGTSLVFVTFYWLETRFFLTAQSRFDDAVGSTAEGRVDGVRLPLATFLLGTLAMMAVASGVLWAAVEAAFRPFLAANLLFWLLDGGGVVVLQRTYRKHEAEIRRVADDHRESWEWFQGHILSRFFHLYAAGNAAVFALALLGDQWSGGAAAYRVGVAVLLALATLLRHLWVRSRLLNRSISRRLQE